MNHFKFQVCGHYGFQNHCKDRHLKSCFKSYTNPFLLMLIIKKGLDFPLLKETENENSKIIYTQILLTSRRNVVECVNALSISLQKKLSRYCGVLFLSFSLGDL